MFKTWFKSASKFTEEEISLLTQKGFKLSNDLTSVALQEDGKLVGNAEIGYADSYTEKSITKYDSFYVAKKEYHFSSSMSYEPESNSDSDEADFPSLSEALQFLSQTRK